MRSAPYKALYGAINWGMSKLHKTYESDFISVPIGKDGRSRAQALLFARDVLRNTTGSQTIGMFPEGDITAGDTVDEFYKGIGVLARSAGRDVTILPTKISRDDSNKLTISFGEPLTANRQETADSITDRVRNAIIGEAKKEIVLH